MRTISFNLLLYKVTMLQSKEVTRVSESSSFSLGRYLFRLLMKQCSFQKTRPYPRTDHDWAFMKRGLRPAVDG